MPPYRVPTRLSELNTPEHTKALKAKVDGGLRIVIDVVPHAGAWSRPPLAMNTRSYWHNERCLWVTEEADRPRDSYLEFSFRAVVGIDHRNASAETRDRLTVAISSALPLYLKFTGTADVYLTIKGLRGISQLPNAGPDDCEFDRVTIRSTETDRIAELMRPTLDEVCAKLT